MANIDRKALHKIGYGLYVLTVRDGEKSNAMICNTVCQVADNPQTLSVAINKANYTHEIVLNTGKMNVNVLSTDCPFSVFEKYGFVSGRNQDKLTGTFQKTENGLDVLPRYINACISLEVKEYIDLGSHGLFICGVTESRVISDKESMTYAYYHANVKPKPASSGVKGYQCKICGYFYAGESLPEDFICPICKHPASDFEPVK